MEEKKVKIAIVHDYLNQFGGAERCLEELHQVFPDAPVYTLIYDKHALPQYSDWDIRQSWLRFVPGAAGLYRFFVPLFPFLVRTFDLKEFDIILSVSHAWVKGIKKGKAKHLCYCLTPVRYAWDLYDEYVKREYIPFFAKPFLPVLAACLRFWDKRAAGKVDKFITISEAIRERVQNYYGMDSEIIYPPVDVDYYTPSEKDERGDHYLTVSRLKPYKRIDLIVEAFTKSGRELHVVGDGPDLARLKKNAGRNIKFLTGLTDREVREEYRSARGFIYAGLEDFGIVMAEAQAAGLPVIAFAKGGALDIIKEDESGVFFKEQTVASLLDALSRFEQKLFSCENVRAASLRFDKMKFRQKIKSEVECLKEARK